MAAAGAQGARTIPFIGATLPYRRKFATSSFITTTATQDVSPTGNAIKSYGFLRAVRLKTTTSVAASAGGTLVADGPFSAFRQVQVSMPGGEEMYGNALFTGYHAYLAAKYSAWKLNNDPKTWGANSFSSSVTAPAFDLPIMFEFGPHGLGSLPNQDFSAPWQFTLVGNTTAGLYTTAPTTTNPTLQTKMYIDAWTPPAPVNPLSREPQQTRPPFLGAISKWTRQNITISGGSAQSVSLVRRGNSFRNLVFSVRDTNSLRLTLADFPDPLQMKWDGATIREDDAPTLVQEDQYMVQGGWAGSTAATDEAGVMALTMAAPFGQATQADDPTGFGMWQFWGTTQSSDLEVSGTWGASVTRLEVLTNDILFTDLSGNPYQFAGGMFLQAPAQASARP